MGSVISKLLIWMFFQGFSQGAKGTQIDFIKVMDNHIEEGKIMNRIG
ncbi:hypothetical protein [Bacillus sp. SD088]|nr:hypothetical protein [Bacillus sp. SD088]MBO0992687.1 hypothetical protein [Bacillus sp. SD088]